MSQIDINAEILERKNLNQQEALEVFGKTLYKCKNDLEAKTKENIDKQEEITKANDELQKEQQNMKTQYSKLEEKYMNLEKKMSDMSMKNDEQNNARYGNDKRFVEKKSLNTWSSVNDVERNFEHYAFTGNVIERKDDMQEFGGYFSFPYLNQYLLQMPSYISPVRKLASKYSIQNGRAMKISFMNEVKISTGDFDVAYDNANSTDAAFENHDIVLCPIEACVNITHDMTQNKPLNFAEFVLNKIAYEISRVERNLFVDGVDGKIESIIPAGEHIIEGDFNYETVIAMVSKLPEEFHDENAAWLMTRRMYNEFLQLTDKSGRFLIHADHHDKYFLNYPIYFMPELADKECELLFCNLKKGYAIVENENLLVLHDKYSKKSLVQNYVRKDIGAKIIRKDAFVGLKTKKGGNK